VWGPNQRSRLRTRQPAVCASHGCESRVRAGVTRGATGASGARSRTRTNTARCNSAFSFAAGHVPSLPNHHAYSVLGETPLHLYPAELLCRLILCKQAAFSAFQLIPLTCTRCQVVSGTGQFQCPQCSSLLEINLSIFG
jgi:hypothetical protein